jgi:tRNA(Ile)-lysidine synthase
MKNSLLTRIHTCITAKNLIPDNSTIIIGLSGGPDSVFLLHALAPLREEKKLTIIAAHLNHEWRAEAEKDEQLCHHVCHQLNIQFISKKMSELNATFKFNGSKEEIGRKARRHFFESLAREYTAQAIALAHHADDQMETFFIRLIRGASLAGLAGMKAKDSLYIRPLLGIKKAEILEYLNEHQITYAIDASNESTDYLRNRIRNSVIPALKLSDDRFENNFASTHEQLQQTEEFLQQFAQKTYSEISVENAVDIQKLLNLHPALRSRVLILWLIAHKVPFIPSQGFFDEIVRFLEKPGNGEHSFYGKWNIKKILDKASIKLLIKT